MSWNTLLILGFLFVAATADESSESVTFRDSLKKFLATLEPYEHLKNDVVFLLDESGSIGVDKFPQVKLFTKMIARQLVVSSEKTRVAVVTFATEPVTHIDYIKNPEGNNMCTLLKKIDDIGYAAEWTHTSKAMAAAEKIFALARPNSNKIIILLTDGESNPGYSPVEIANQLKARGVIIFAIGVASVNENEILDVATSPDHTYILDDFNYIVKVNKHLVEDVNEDSLDLAQNSTYCKISCDDHAKCYCGARTGMYECVCNAGYYGTNGFKGHCHKCPKGTYKAKADNSDCAPCPEHSTTFKEGSTSFSECRCDTGYDKVGNFCEPLTCAVLRAPDGGILIPTHCNNTYGTQCSFKCDTGYCPFSCNDYPPHPMDNHIILPKRSCLENRLWSNEEFHCEKMSCPALSLPHNGMHNCSENSFTYGTTCHFKCDKGYELHGPDSRTCGFKGWTGQDARCKEIHCDKLKTNDLLNVKPVNCSTNPSPYRSVCRYFCKKGYSLVLPGNNTDGILKCEHDKKWSQSYDKISCKDIEPPKIRCPKSITVSTDPHRNNAFVIWDKPNATDNVGVADIRIIEPRGIKKLSHHFPIGVTKIVYEAIDYSKITKTCSFNVEVLDREPPNVVSCPSDIQIYHHKNKPIPVKWKGPEFEDNSKHLTVTCNRKSGDTFAWGPASTVICTASDSSKNNASCSFSVKVKHYPCPYYDPPANGIVTCDNWGDGRLCSIFCHEGFEFASDKHLHNVYLCNQVKHNGNIVGKWEPFLKFPGFKMPWPDCSRKQAPASLDVSIGISYSVDSCSEEKLKKMRESFFNYIKKLPSTLCPQKKGCSPENVNVTCSPITVRRKRSSDSNIPLINQEFSFNHISKYNRLIRETPKQILTISFHMLMQPNATEQNFDVKPSNEPAKENEIGSSSNSFLKELKDEISLELKHVYNVTSVPEPEVNYGAVVICTIGQISVNNSCVNCPAGSYKDDVSGSCISCPTASYQDEEQQLSCKPCPIGHTTYEVKSKSPTDCKGPCQPGTYSETTFEPCLACPLNTYQERSARKECLKCPSGFYTWRVGANSSSDCVAPCKPGSFSDTGFEPCTLCEIGSFQNKEMQKNCTSCPNRTSTIRSGSRNINDCKEVDICKEIRPCQYESTCIQLDKDYECVCPKGLMGKHCEVNSDDCESSPCLNGGTCVDGIQNFTCLCPDGWEGHQCETNQDDCKSNPCLNGGECIDKINSYECQCLAGFTGDRCEKNIYECESNPCINNGTCFDMKNDYRCCCSKGYIGKNCEKKLNSSICDMVTCQNGGTCLADSDDFNCICLSGYEGKFCESSIDNCKEFHCENGGTCVNGRENSTCICPSKFVGLYCEEALSPEYLLSFPTPDTSNYAKVENHHNLYTITVAFFMRTNFKDSNSRATPVSYSYVYHNHLQDNALTLLDTNNFVIYIHGQSFHTEYSANSDTSWHHYAVTWEQKDGKWVFYVDGKLFVSGYAGKGKYMHPGTFILGQEQDEAGGRFSTLEAFAGDITEFNVWDYAFTEEEIKRISSSCGYTGNVIPWYTVSQAVYGNVMVLQDVDKCKALGNCPENSCDCFYSNATDVLSCKHDVKGCVDDNTCSNKQPCISIGERSFCNCSSGFEGRHCEYDIDECLENNGGCNYICKNDVGTGSYHCECPEDMFLSEDGKTCKDTSYCLKDGHIYVHGERWEDSCQTCSCEHGIVLCEEILCNETTCLPEETMITSPGECCPKCVAWSFCLVSPNNTLLSFDMSNYRIEGECAYTAVEDCIGGRFKVQIESSENSLNETKIVIYEDCYKIIVSSNGSVLVDDSIVALPFENEEVIIEYIDSSVTVKTCSDLLVQWNFSDEAVIAVPITDIHKICGVCSKIENYYLHGTGKFPLTERSSGENECFIAEHSAYRSSGSLNRFSHYRVLPDLLVTAFMCLLIKLMLM